jgi:hypothetical protein
MNYVSGACSAGGCFSGIHADCIKIHLPEITVAKGLQARALTIVDSAD